MSKKEENELNYNPKRISYIYVATPPTKTVYYAGEFFNTAGMVIKAHYTDNTESIINIYIYSPQVALTTNDTYITVRYNSYSTTYPITVNEPIVFSIPEQNLSQSNLGDNPLYNLYDQSIRFATNPILVNRDSYAISFNLVYHSRMNNELFDLINGLPSRFKTNFHQYLITDGFDANSNQVYKYVDGDGYIHTFSFAYDNFYYCNQSKLYLSFYTINSVTQGRIIDENGNELHFDNSGRLIKIVSSNALNNVKHIVYNDDYIDYIYDEREANTKIIYHYDNSHLLERVSFVYKNNILKSLGFYYSNDGLLTSIIESSSIFQDRTLYTFLYNQDGENSSYNRIEYIKDHLNNVSYHASYIYYAGYDDYIVSRLETGVFNNGGSFIVKDSLTRINHENRNDNSTSKIIIKNYNNIYLVYYLNRKAKITASFECNQFGDSLKTLYKESGDYIDINGNLSTTINSRPFKNITSPLAIPLSDSIVIHLNSYKHFVLRMYVKLNSSIIKRAKAILAADDISSSVINLDVDQYNGLQLIEIPFTRQSDNLDNVTFNLSFKDENDYNISVDIADLYLDKKERNVLALAGGLLSFERIDSINLYGVDSQNPHAIFNNSSYPYFSEEDLVHTLRFNKIRSHYFSSLPSIIFLCHGEKTNTFENRFEIVAQIDISYLPLLITDSDLYSSNYWFYMTKSIDDRIETRTYYQFVTVDNVTYFEVITRMVVNNDQSTLQEEIKRYSLYNNRLLSVIKDHYVDNELVSSETTYSYFDNGEVASVSASSTTNNTYESISLYGATQNTDGYINQKTNGISAINISYNNDAISSFNCQKHEDNILNTYYKNIGYDHFNDEIASVTFLCNQDSLAINGLFNNYANDEVLYNLNNETFYKLTNDLFNDISYVKRYNGSSYENILSVKKTPTLNEVTFYKEDSSDVIKRDFDIYGKVMDEKLNNVTMVSFNYDTNGIESLTVLKNLTSVNDGYINKITTFQYNGFDFYESLFFNEYFEIKRYYNGFSLYCFGQENYLFEPIANKLDIYSGNARIENLSIEHVYDGFNRLLNKKRIKNDSNACFLEDIYYYQQNSTLYQSFTHKNFNIDLINETYSYDELGNLYSVSVLANDSNALNSIPIVYSKTFNYDGFNRITYESNPSYPLYTRFYFYDEKGRMEYFGNDQLMYNNQGQLVSFGIITFTYDKYGNRTKKIIGNDEITYSWIRGTLLENINSGEISFTYDYRGIRYSKVTNQETVTYFYDGNRLIGEDHEGKTNQNTTYPSYKLRFFYDNDGTPTGLRYIHYVNNNEVIDDYIYIVNPFKEIIGISYYNGSISSLVCSLEAIYIYDAWGNHQVYKSSGLIDDNPYSIGNINPLRYKGYYYDKETNLYYLMTRYYDPSIGQFISPDDYTYLDINKVSGYHLYAYCNNNPVMNEDPDGHMPDWAKWIIGGVTIVGLGIATFFTGGAAGVVLGAAFYGAVTGAVTGAVVNGLIQGGIAGVNGEDFWENFFHGAADGFMWGAIIGGATSAAVSGLNIATGGVQIIGSSQKTGYLFHRFVSNVNAGKFSMQIGRYSTISLNRSLKSVGLNGGLRPDVLALGSHGSRVIEVVSRTQTIFDQTLKIESMKAINAGLQGIAVDWFLGGWFYL